jgi:hypothetical protein
LWLQYEVRTDDITIIILSIQDITPKNQNTNSLPSLQKTPSLRSVIVNTSSLNGVNTASNPRDPTPTKPNMITASARLPPLSSLRRGSNSSVQSQSSHSRESESESNVSVSLNLKPVRRTISREKRKNVIQLATEHIEDDKEDIDMEALAVPKTEKDHLTISSYLQKNFLFQHLSIAQMNIVVNVMQPVVVKKGDTIIRQGDPGDKFYIIDSGRFEVRVISSASSPRAIELGGDLVYVYDSTNDLHPGFGELSLM